MIIVVLGGAVIPLISWLTDSISLTAGMLVLVFCAVYLLTLSVFASAKK
jgi:hypothetical protein